MGHPARRRLSDESWLKIPLSLKTVELPVYKKDTPVGNWQIKHQLLQSNSGIDEERTTC